MNIIGELKELFGDVNTITTSQFEELYSKVRPYFVSKYGEPERSFVSVVGFGNKCRKEIKTALNGNGINIFDPPVVDPYDLQEHGMKRLAELQNKTK